MLCHNHHSKSMDKETKMITITQAARELSVTVNTIYARIHDGTLPATFNPSVKSRRWLVDADAVEKLKRIQYKPESRLKALPPASLD